MTLEEVLEELYELENQELVAYRKTKFGIVSHNALGIAHKDLSLIAKTIGKDTSLALQLFDSGIYEAKLLCSKIVDPKEMTEDLMDKWVKTFENWEVCDSFCMGLFAKSKFALAKIIDWNDSKLLYQKRAAFATMAAFCNADKYSNNDLFIQFFPLIKEAASDDRLYVKKAVNWALRSIGKRNRDLNKAAIQEAQAMLNTNSKSAVWIAKNALVELQKEGVRMSDYPRKIYRP